MKLVLAPMEGLTDFYMRDMLTHIATASGYDWCVSEFIRVTEQVLPARSFYHACPELLMAGKTRAGTPVHIQLLGSDPQLLAENAAYVAELGATAIDLNFGCPAKTVNRHRGGAILLDEPELVYDIVARVRRAVPAAIPVSAKMRLGVEDKTRMLENAQAIESAGANWLTVHARTKANGYKPPADWQALAEIRQQITIAMLANGDIFGPEDAEVCRTISQCPDLMLGRGAIRCPDLVLRIRQMGQQLTWTELLAWQHQFLTGMFQRDLNVPYLPKWTENGAVGRYKQWLAMLTQCYPEAWLLFQQIKGLRRMAEIEPYLIAKNGQ